MIVPALPVPLWVFNPLKYNPQKGLKPTEEEDLPPDLLIRLLKQTAKERMRGEGWPIPYRAGGIGYPKRKRSFLIIALLLS